ncbi:tetratricopeptide repeat 24-like [Pelobates cultripes]|uniref:Tetratricopeptide repeat 24-like n=1 Tax=Pelobates cultripes TaxID=61616 RepID=A0AAD1RMD3_PELCU|nr:tetratricopeptide repeat 24-like [Pelobates cultripes]
MAASAVLKSPEENKSEPSQTIKTEIRSLYKDGSQSLRNDDINTALKSFKRAYILSCKLTNKKLQKACLFNLGASYICIGKPKKALKCLIKSRTNGLEGQDGDLYFNVAAAYDEMKEHDKAVKFYERAINEYGFDEVNNIADALIKLGYCFVAVEDLSSAAHSFRLAGHSYLKIARTEDAVMAMREAANFMIKSQQFSKTEIIQTLDSCVQSCSSVDDKKLLGTLYNHIGLHYAEIKCFSQARRCFAEGMNLCSGKQFSIRKMAVLLQNLGAVDNALYQYEKSLKNHAEAADIYGTLGERNSQGQCLCNLAFAYSQLRNYEMAEFYYLQALIAFQDAGDVLRQSQVSEGLGATYFCLGNHDESIFFYKQALALFGKSKETADLPRERILQKLADAIEYKLTQQHTASIEKSILRTQPEPSPSNSINDAYKSFTSQYHESCVTDGSAISDTSENQKESKHQNTVQPKTRSYRRFEANKHRAKSHPGLRTQKEDPQADLSTETSQPKLNTSSKICTIS